MTWEGEISSAINALSPWHTSCVSIHMCNTYLQIFYVGTFKEYSRIQLEKGSEVLI